MINQNNETSLVKTYVLDTNVLLSDPNAIYSFEEHNLVIPMVVLEELDRHKSRQDEVGKNARCISRTLDDMRDSKNSLITGIKLHNGGTLYVVSFDDDPSIKLPKELQNGKVDNQIIAYMLTFKQPGAGSLGRACTVTYTAHKFFARCVGR
jgi:PhoH-like ATPase